MKFYIVPNWNFSIKKVCKFDSVESLYSYADLHNIIVSLVEDNSFHCKKFNLPKNSVIYVGW